MAVQSELPVPDVVRPPATPASSSALRVGSLDGVRGVAVLAVMAFHIGAPGFKQLGWIGVDVFFVLSGFLITSLLVTEQKRTGRIHLGRFWARRFLRLMPAYWLYIGAMTVLCLRTPLAEFGDGRPGTRGVFIASMWAYFINYYIGTEWPYQSLTSHLWSLAVEEQFYFLWPLLMLAILHLRRAWVAGWLLVAALVVHGYVNRPSLFHLDGRGVGIALGCAAALSLRDGLPPRLARLVVRPGLRWGFLAGTLAAVGLFGLQGLIAPLQTGLQRLALNALCVFFTGLTVLLWYGPPDRLAGLFSWRPLAYTGKISYGLYLYHMAAHFLVWDVWLATPPFPSRYLSYGVRSAAFFALSFALAMASYHAYEKRFLALKDRFR